MDQSFQMQCNLWFLFRSGSLSSLCRKHSSEWTAQSFQSNWKSYQAGSRVHLMVIKLFQLLHWHSLRDAGRAGHMASHLGLLSRLILSGSRFVPTARRDPRTSLLLCFLLHVCLSNLSVTWFVCLRSISLVSGWVTSSSSALNLSSVGIGPRRPL